MLQGTFKMVALGIVAARLDNCNSLLYGTSPEVAGDTECTGPRVVCQAARTCSATELSRTLHWLPVKQRIDCKLAVLTLWSWLTKHFLLVLQRSGMTCLLTVF